MVIGQNSDLNFGGGGGLSRAMGVTEGRNSPLQWLKEHIAPILHIKYPQTGRAYNTFLPGAYHYFHISQPAKNCLRNRSFAEQIHWVPKRYVICSSRFLSFFYSFIYYFYIFFPSFWRSCHLRKCPSLGTNPLSPLSFQVPIPE